MMPNWLKYKALPVAGFVVVAVAGLFVLRWLSGNSPETEVRKDLELAWGDAIGQFRIAPIFPPEEDYVVGDILAYIIEDQTKDFDPIDYRTPSVKRSIKFARVNVKAELQENYSEFAVFPRAMKAQRDGKPPAGGDSSAPVPPSVPRLFTNGEVLEADLPHAAFARLRSSQSSSAAGALTANNMASANYSGSSQGVEEFQLDGVSTYGLPAAVALKKLQDYCAGKETKEFCQETTVRQHLSTLIGDRIFFKNLDQDGRDVYAVKVALVIINRVYLARSIVHRRRAGKTESGGLLAGWFSGKRDKVEASNEQKPAAEPAGAPTDDTALKQRVAELEKQVSRMRAGGGLSAQSSSNDESDLNIGPLDRPVAIGFRYVLFEFPSASIKTSNRTQ
jgi:hypothetical protein